MVLQSKRTSDQKPNNASHESKSSPMDRDMYHSNDIDENSEANEEIEDMEIRIDEVSLLMETNIHVDDGKPHVPGAKLSPQSSISPEVC